MMEGLTEIGCFYSLWDGSYNEYQTPPGRREGARGSNQAAGRQGRQHRGQGQLLLGAVLAAQKGHEAFVKLLLDKGTNFEAKEITYGRTPMSWAAEEGHEGVVKLLLEKGADLLYLARVFQARQTRT